MLSPYRNFVNAEITFLKAGIPTTNAAGNITTRLVPLITVTAFVKAVDKRPDKHRPEGIPESAIAYECIAVSPMVLPPEIKPLQRAIAKISGEEGEFILENGPLNPPYGREGLGASLEQRTGTKFYGWFTRK